jgi:MFS family permease
MAESSESESEALLSDSGQRVRSWSSLRYSQFRLLVGSAILGSIGNQMREIVNLWVVFEQTGSALQLGILGTLRVVPLIVVGFLGGILADVVDRRKILLFGQGTSLVLTGTLAVLMLTGNIQVWHIFAATLLNSSATVLDQPARMALVSGAVPRSHLANAVTMTSGIHHSSLLIGPSIGGVLIAIFDPGIAYAVNASLFVPSLILVALLSALGSGAGQRRPKIRPRDLFEGFLFVKRTPILVALLVLDFGVVSFTGYRVLTPIFAEDILGIGAKGIGLLTSAPAIGFLFGTVFMLVIGDITYKGRLVIVSTIAYAIAIFAYAASDFWMLSLLALVGVGLFDGIGSIVRRTTLQLAVPDEIRGRATAVSQMVTRGTSSAGALTTGALAAAFGADEALMIGSGLAMIALVVVLVFWGSVLRSRF